MSLLNVIPLRDEVCAKVATAWNPSEIHKGTPRLVKSTVPFACVYLDGVSSEWITVCDVEQSYSFEIVGVFQIEDGTYTEDEKVERANELITELMNSAHFAEFGMVPTIANVEFSESDDPNESVYEVSVTFTVIVHEPGLVA